MPQVDLSKYNNDEYQPGSSIKRICWYIVNLVFFKSGCFPFYKLKVFLLRGFGANVGKGVIIKPCVNIKYAWNLSIGNYTWIGEGVWIDNLGKIMIGNSVCLSQGAMLLCGNHNYNSKQFDLMVKDIILEDGCWIGAKAIVCGGITCGSHAVLAVASVANNNLEPYGIYQGNPAVKIKTRQIG